VSRRESQIRAELEQLWIRWCRLHEPNPDAIDWPGECFVRWAGEVVRVNVVATLADEEQCERLRELAPDAADRWPPPPLWPRSRK
jgi:hypothetical protein